MIPLPAILKILVLLWPLKLEELLKTLEDPTNPIYLSIFFVAIFFFVIFLFYKYLINPSISQYKEEKESIELKSAKLMALFAELDPDPVIRIDLEGTIIETNKAAEEVLSQQNLKGKKINKSLPFIDFDLEEAITNNKTKVFTKKINERFFSILFRGELNLNIAQIYFRDITELKTFEEKLIESQNKLRELSDHLQDLIEKERQKIAWGLHDSIGQSLSMLRIRLLRLSENSDLQKYNGSFHNLISTLEEAISELKDISYSLKPKMLEEMGLGIALKHLINKVSEETGMRGEITVIDDEIRLDNKLEISFYRIAQEAINNILKYSFATNFSLQLLITKNIIRIIVSDNGIGFEADQILFGKKSSPGMGLLNIKERVESFHGKFKIDSAPGKGTMLVAEIPLKNEQRWQNQNRYAF